MTAPIRDALVQGRSTVWIPSLAARWWAEWTSAARPLRLKVDARMAGRIGAGNLSAGFQSGLRPTVKDVAKAWTIHIVTEEAGSAVGGPPNLAAMGLEFWQWLEYRPSFETWLFL
ncbi:hypothetical protein ACJZ2D_013173 [Fusarium nematophilum]